MNNKPIGGRSSDTYSHLIDMNMDIIVICVKIGRPIWNLFIINVSQKKRVRFQFLKEAVSTSETSAYFFEYTRRFIPEDCHLQKERLFVVNYTLMLSVIVHSFSQMDFFKSISPI
jgi:hypothetical protein